jgi:DNA polymerase III subunit beta
MLAFSADRADLANAISRASQGLASNPPQPIYAGMLFSAENGELTITASDGDMTFSAGLNAKVHSDENPDSPGQVLIPGKMISEISRYFTGKTITVDYRNGGTAEITAGRAKFTLSADSGKKYPKWQDPPAPVGLLDAEEFAMAVRRVAPAASKSHPVMRGMYLAPIDGRLYIAATDRFRMAVMAPEWIRHKDESRDDVFPALTGKSVLERFAKAAGDDDTYGTVTLGWNEKIIGMGIPGLQATSRLLSGIFPKDWKSILDNAPQFCVTFDAAELTRVVKMALLAAGEGRVDLTFDGNDLHVTASQQGRTFSDYLDVEYDGDEITIAMGAQILLDGLSGCRGEAKIAMTTAGSPVFLRSGSYNYMCQPRRDMKEEVND